MTIDTLITGKIRLPSPPAIAVRILQAVEHEEVSLEEIVAIIQTDPALTARLLKVANSSMYSLQYRVATLQKALTVLGVNVLKNIALSFVISEEFSQDGEGFDLDYFWRRSVTAAVAAELIAKLVGEADDNAFVTGLLQDIGVLLFYRHDPGLYRELLAEHYARKIPISDVERARFGFDHAELGAYLLEQWGLPNEITAPMRFHHLPAESKSKVSQSAGIQQLADRLSAVYHTSGSVPQVQELKAFVSDRYGLSQEMISLLIDDVAEKAREVMVGFDLNPGELRPYSQMLQDANQALGELSLCQEEVYLELQQTHLREKQLREELDQANGQLREQAVRDNLTGLYNQSYFRETLEQQLHEVRRYGTCFGLLMFDLDHFKTINDEFGHLTGDWVLKAVAELVKDLVRECDVLCRVGGDEFILILPRTDLPGMKKLAERLRTRVATLRLPAISETLTLSVSVGGLCCLQKDRVDEAELLVEAVDKLLYQAKRDGRNMVVTGTVWGEDDHGRE